MSDNTPEHPADVPIAPSAARPAHPSYPAPTPPQDAPGAPNAYAPPAAYPQSGGYPQQQPAPYGYAGAYPYAAAPKTNGLAITSLVSSIAAFVVLPFIASIVAVITGHIALRQLRTSGENGRGMALAGTIVGWVGVGLGLIFIAFIVFAVIIGISSESGYTSYS